MSARRFIAGFLVLGEFLLSPGWAVTPVQSGIRAEYEATNLEVVVSWEGNPRRLYQVRSKTDWTAPWEVVNELPLVTGPEGSSMVFTHRPLDPQRFYQVVDLDFVWIEPGQFVMGTPNSEVGRFDEEGPLVSVTLTRGYWMARYEVTQREYQNLMATNPSFVIGTRVYPNPVTVFGTNLCRPVEFVTWLNAAAYCQRLNTVESAAGRLPAGFVYRLPTESEWEYACRAGTTTPYSCGTELRAGMANFDWRYEYDARVGTVQVPDAEWPTATTSVGSFPPNPWGLYDMHGNVFEWCQDWWAPYYAETVAVDPTGPETGTNRSMRGGCWNYPGYRLRSGHRRGHTPDFKSLNVGFRVVLAAPIEPREE